MTWWRNNQAHLECGTLYKTTGLDTLKVQCQRKENVCVLSGEEFWEEHCSKFKKTPKNSAIQYIT